jgi:hypothetical protein
MRVFSSGTFAGLPSVGEGADLETFAGQLSDFTLRASPAPGTLPEYPARSRIGRA